MWAGQPVTHVTSQEYQTTSNQFKKKSSPDLHFLGGRKDYHNLFSMLILELYVILENIKVINYFQCKIT